MVDDIFKWIRSVSALNDEQLKQEIDLIKSAPRVIFWYRLCTLGRSPIVVINATQGEAGQNYAGLTGAVGTLVDKYKLRVVVDGSPNLN